MATLGGARAMGISDQVGTLEVGKLADVILIDMNDLGFTPVTNPVSNLVYSGSGHAVDTVIVNGKPLMRGKKLITLNEAAVMERAMKQSKPLLERAGIDIQPKWPIE
jgi:cytosine/adenosine deaminase-related metal-dependent hydrolase